MEMERKVAGRAMVQHGLVTRRDLVNVGATRGVVRGLVARGALVPIGRQTFRIGGAPISDHQRVMAACLDTGGVAAGRTAAWLHGLDGFLAGDPPEVLVARPRSEYRVPGARVHSTTWLPPDDTVVVDAVPTLGVARTLFSLSALVPADLDLDVVHGAVDDAIRDGKARDAWLWWSLERIRCRGRNGVSVLEGILDIREGGGVTESWLERETLKVLDAGGLPPPVCQRRVKRSGSFVARVDFTYPGTRLVMEVSGYRWHRTRRQMAADLERRRALTLAGFWVLEYTYDDVVFHPERIVAEIAEAIEQFAA